MQEFQDTIRFGGKKFPFRSKIQRFIIVNEGRSTFDSFSSNEWKADEPADIMAEVLEARTWPLGLMK